MSGRALLLTAGGRAVLDRLKRWFAPAQFDGAPAADNDDFESAALPAPDAAGAAHLFLEEGLLHIDGERLALSTPGGGTRHMRLRDLVCVSVHGQAGATTPAVRALIAAGIPLIWRDAAGRLAGLAQGARADTAARRAQYAAQDDSARRLTVARAMVEAKILSARGLLRRRSAGAATVRRLAELAESAKTAASIPSLLGTEGAAAALYFEAFAGLIAPGTGFAFQGRRRPAADPVNALLSYAYAVIAGEAFAAAAAAGLDPHAGFLHTDRAGRPALALDLMEPLRPLAADRAVLSLINRREISPAEFEPDETGAMRLSLAARKSLIAALEARWAAALPGGGSISLRSVLFNDAARLASALRKGEDFSSRLVLP